MIVPDRDHEKVPRLDAESAGTLHGSIGGIDGSLTDDRPREPIGFRMPAREQPIDPSWMLL